MSELITENQTILNEDDYDVIIEEAGIGDPIAVFALNFGQGKSPTLQAPLKKVSIKVSLLWTERNHRIDLGRIQLKKVSTSDSYLFTIPYDDRLFNRELENQVSTDLILIISAKNSLGLPVKFASGQPIGKGEYMLVYKNIIPKLFSDLNEIFEKFRNN